MNKSDIFNVLIDAVENQGRKVAVYTDAVNGWSTVDRVSGVHGTTFFRTIDGQVLTAAEIKNVRVYTP